MRRNTRDTWGSVAKTLHWSIAALILLQLCLGLAAVGWKLSPTKLDLFVWHKSFGMLILLLVLVRLGWRLANPVPDLPAATTAWERSAAQASHGLLYVLTLALPLSGWMLNSAAGIPARLFRMVPLPNLVAPDESLQATLKLVHNGLALALVLVLAVHIGAALRHHFSLRDPVLQRMLPSRRSAR